MSTFKVESKLIDRVWTHPNADNLELASVGGMSFQFVVQKGVYYENDIVVYFPIDSILPDELIDACGLTGKLSGNKKNRLKTVKLRGEISQGFVIKAHQIIPFLRYKDTIDALANGFLDLDLTEELGVIKYEPPVIPCKSGNLVSLPTGVSVYDIEGADRYPQVVDELMDELVWVSEKLEGTNWSLTIDNDDVIHVSTRRHAIIELEDKENDYWRTARNQGLVDLAKDMKAVTRCNHIILRGELVGPGWQKNIYNLNEQQIYLFDIQCNGKYLPPDSLYAVLEDFGVEDWIVPTIAMHETLASILNGKTVQEFSNGTSLLFKTRREGIVIKPIIPMHSNALNGRLIIKQRSPEYLAKSDL